MGELGQDLGFSNFPNVGCDVRHIPGGKYLEEVQIRRLKLCPLKRVDLIVDRTIHEEDRHTSPQLVLVRLRENKIFVEELVVSNERLPWIVGGLD